MRADGAPAGVTVARVIAFGSGSPARSASSNQRSNWRIGSAIGLRFRESGAHVFLAQVGDVHARDSTAAAWLKPDCRGKVSQSPSEKR